MVGCILPHGNGLLRLPESTPWPFTQESASHSPPQVTDLPFELAASVSVRGIDLTIAFTILLSV